jgi:FtsP/CotA-like multicopper oxidase with cupredoxin domain
MSRRTTTRTTPAGKGSTQVTGETKDGSKARFSPIDRRTFLALGTAGAATMVASASMAAAVTAGGPNPSPRSDRPVGLDPATGRDTVNGRAFHGDVYRLALAATDGFVSMPQGADPIAPYFPDPIGVQQNRTTYTFGFRNVTDLDQPQVAAQKGMTQVCAPLFGVPADSELWVVLTNLGLQLRPDLVDSHTLHWHGFRNAIPFYDGVPETSISVPIGRDFTYVFRPKDAGTYMYHCHFEDVEHVTMGMTGIVYVTPTDAVPGGHKGLTYGVHDGAPVPASNDTAYDREYAIILTEIDSRAHWNDAHIQTTDWTDFHPEFWLMNGRAYPDTVKANGVRNPDGSLSHPTDAHLDQQPLSSLIECNAGEKVLIRLVNLGFQNHTLTLPGIPMDVVGRDARYVPAAARRKATDTVQLGPGESRDIIITPTAAGTFPFFNRDLSRYTGSSTDASGQWLGGQRTHVVVSPAGTLGAQPKPNGHVGDTDPLAGGGPLPTFVEHLA